MAMSAGSKLRALIRQPCDFGQRPNAIGHACLIAHPVRSILSSACAAARWTASQGVFSQAEPVEGVRECSRPVTKNVHRQPSGYWVSSKSYAWRFMPTTRSPIPRQESSQRWRD